MTIEGLISNHTYLLLGFSALAMSSKVRYQYGHQYMRFTKLGKRCSYEMMRCDRINSGESNRIVLKLGDGSDIFTIKVI